MPAKAKFRSRNPRLKRNLINKVPFQNEKQVIRESHRNPEFENKEDLVDERYKIQCDINELRKENTRMKKEIRELEEKYALNEQAKIDYNEKTKNIGDAVQLKRLLNFTQQLNDLKILQVELDSQYEFLDKFYDETNRNELASTTSFLSKQVEENSIELLEMENVIKKAEERMAGPVANQRKLFLQKKRRIKALKKLRSKLRLDQETVEPCNFIKKVVILPEELEAERDELKHKLEVLQHRKYNRQKEIEEMKLRRLKQKQDFAALVQHKQLMEKESLERREFCARMKKIREKENQKKENAVIIGNTEEENWDPFTLAKEAHE